jgi:hypothetical protein
VTEKKGEEEKEERRKKEREREERRKKEREIEERRKKERERKGERKREREERRKKERERGKEISPFLCIFLSFSFSLCFSEVKKDGERCHVILCLKNKVYNKVF